MSAVLAFLTNQKATIGSALAGLLLLFFDQEFIATLHGLGVEPAMTGVLVSLAKAATLVLAALGYSPVKRPPQ